MLNTKLALLLLCASIVTASMDASHAQDKAITSNVWQEVVVSVTDLERTARFFLDIGGYQEKWRGAIKSSELESWGLLKAASGEALLLGQENRDEGFIRLLRFDNAGRKEPTRPGSRAWDSGCYFSIMVRMKDMQSVYDDAIKLGWWTETPITQHSLGDSHLNIMIFQGPDGVQVQAYERLSLPIPEDFPDFERFSGPFNAMQIVRDRDAAYDFYTRVLGFDTFYKGKPYVSKKPVFGPLGIPKNLSTSARFRAGIVYPFKGELGRMEMIEMMDLEGHDYADRCDAPNLGMLAVRFPVASLEQANARLKQNDWPIQTLSKGMNLPPYGKVDLLSIKTPDGANIQFYQEAK